MKDVSVFNEKTVIYTFEVIHLYTVILQHMFYNMYMIFLIKLIISFVFLRLKMFLFIKDQII